MGQANQLFNLSSRFMVQSCQIVQTGYPLPMLYFVERWHI